MTRPSPEHLTAAGAPIRYSPEEAAAILPGLSVNWLKRKAGLGAIPSTRVGRACMFSPEDLTAIAAAGARGPRLRSVPTGPAPSVRAEAAGGVPALTPRVPRRKRGAA